MPDYIRTPYVQDPRTMLDLMRLASAERSRADQNRAAVRSQGVMNIGQLIAGTLASIGQEREQRAKLQAQAARQQQEDALKVRDQQLREADLLARANERQQAAERQAQMDQRQAQMDAATRGTKAVEDMGGYGPLAESQVDDVMQSPAAGRTRYSFGPGQANGPEVQPSAPQLQQMEMRKKLEGMGYSFGPNGQVIPPQKPEAPPRPVSVPDGGRLVDPVTGRVVYTAPPKPVSDSEPLVPMIDPKTGKRIYGTRAQAQGTEIPAGAEKPSSGVQRHALTFFNRAAQADKDLASLEANVDKYGLLQQGRMKYAPNFMQTEEGQLYNQAQRAFTEARLRKDSGAAIPETEFANDRVTYFPQPGDTPKTLEQKSRARAKVLASLAFESGQALGEYLGDADEAASVIAAYKERAGDAPKPKVTNQPIKIGGFTVREKP